MKSIYLDYLRQAIVQICSLLSSMAWTSFYINACDFITSSLTAALYSFVWMSYKYLTNPVSFSAIGASLKGAFSYIYVFEKSSN